jgi:hypothetical protein
MTTTHAPNLNIATTLHADWECGEWVDGYFDKFDADQFASVVKDSGVEALEFWAKDHFGITYYPSKFAPQHRCLNGRDVFGEMCEASLRHGLVPRGCVMVLMDSAYAFAHRDSIAKNRFGAECWARMMGMEMHDPAYLCPNHKPYREYLKHIVEEIIRNYPIRSILLDMIIWPGQMDACYCETCQKMFKDLTGSNIPQAPTWDALWKTYTDWKYQTLEDYGWDLQHHVHKVSSKVNTKFNAQAYPLMAHSRYGHRPVQHMSYTDVTLTEVYPSWGSIMPSFNTRYARAAAPDRGYPEVGLSSTCGQAFTARTPAQIEWDIYTIFANRGYWNYVIQIFSTGIHQYPTLDRLKPILADRDAHKDLFEEGQFIKEVGLYYSHTTRDWYRKDFITEHAEQPRSADNVGTGASATFGVPKLADERNHALSNQGAYLALQESQIHTDVLLEDNVTLEQMCQFPLVLLPNVAILSAREQQIIRDYVSQGGSLIATADTSLYNEMGGKQADFALADLFAVHYKGGSPTRYNFLRLPKELSKTCNSHPDYFTPISGPLNVIEGENVEGELWDSYADIAPYRAATIHNPESPTRLLGPAIARNQYGKGRVIYLPFDLTLTYASMDAQQEHRHLLKALAQELLGQRELAVEAPTTVEAVQIYDDKRKRYVIHLIGYNAGRHQSYSNFKRGEPIINDAPMYRVKITTKAKIQKVQPMRPTTTIVETAPHSVSLIVESVHEAVQIHV